MLQLAWNKVTETTVSNCFRHEGFKQEPTEISETITTDMQQWNESVVDSDEMSLFEQLRDLVPDGMSAEAFYRVNPDLICEEATIETFIADVQQNNLDNSPCSMYETQGDSDDDISEEIKLNVLQLERPG